MGSTLQDDMFTPNVIADPYRRLGAVLRKEIFDIYAAIPSSWNTRRMAA